MARATVGVTYIMRRVVRHRCLAKAYGIQHDQTQQQCTADLRQHGQGSRSGNGWVKGDAAGIGSEVGIHKKLQRVKTIKKNYTDETGAEVSAEKPDDTSGEEQMAIDAVALRPSGPLYFNFSTTNDASVVWPAKIAAASDTDGVPM